MTIGYTRDGARRATATITTASRTTTAARGSASRSSRSSRTRSTLKIDLDDIGGPSAGLMFTLGIIDKLEPDDLTGGKIIAGTGTIDDEGNVGPIGGIPQKLVGAKRRRREGLPRARPTTAPRRCATPQPGLPLLKVATLDDALNALETLACRGPAGTLLTRRCSIAQDYARTLGA